MMSIIWTILIGFVIGLVARAVQPGDDKLSLIWTTVLGVAGSFLAKFVGQAAGWYGDGQSAGWIASTVGALILLFGYSFYKRSQNKV